MKKVHYNSTQNKVGKESGLQVKILSTGISGAINQKLEQ